MSGQKLRGKITFGQAAYSVANERDTATHAQDSLLGSGRSMDPSADEVISSLMGSSDAASLMDAIKRLTNLMDEAYGAAAADLAGALRQAGAVGLICELLDNPDAPVHRRAMAILGNLVADVFDPLAFESVALAKASGALPKLIAHLSKPFPNNLYAGACLQNMTAVDGDACDYLSKHDAAPVLEAMLQADDDQVRASASALNSALNSAVTAVPSRSPRHPSPP